MGEIQIVGAGQASELRTALRKVSDEIGDVVLSELEDIASGVASAARARVPYRTGAARNSYRARGATISFGDGVPYVPWLEFGGRVGRNESVARPYIKAGRYIYPTLGERMKDIEKRIDDLISAITHGHLEVQ